MQIWDRVEGKAGWAALHPLVLCWGGGGTCRGCLAQMQPCAAGAGCEQKGCNRCSVSPAQKCCISSARAEASVVGFFLISLEKMAGVLSSWCAVDYNLVEFSTERRSLAKQKENHQLTLFRVWGCGLFPFSIIIFGGQFCTGLRMGRES